MTTCFNVSRGNYQPNFTWKLNRVMKLMRYQAFVMRSKTTFPLINSNIKARPMLSMDAQGTVSIWLKLSGSTAAAAILQRAPLPTVFYVLKDPVRVAPFTQHAVRPVAYTAHIAFNYALLYKRRLFAKSWFASFTHMQNDSVVLEVVVEKNLTVPRAVHSYDGALTFLLDNYLARKIAEERCLVEQHESPYFYTAEDGFRVQVWLSVRLDEGVKLGMALMAGEHDQRLPRTFAYHATFALTRPDGTFGIETEFAVEEKVVNKFIPCRFRDYIQNDCLLIHVQIEAGSV